jgi:hypothetical protein|mmetsp:Transcript_73950/g.124525  ORF Transcript_73950/g.124525 Transcript_73950/m.124525 type:complete len:213 (+) Transcript_73950:89-727(+)
MKKRLYCDVDTAHNARSQRTLIRVLHPLTRNLCGVPPASIGCVCLPLRKHGQGQVKRWLDGLRQVCKPQYKCQSWRGFQNFCTLGWAAAEELHKVQCGIMHKAFQMNVPRTHNGGHNSGWHILTCSGSGTIGHAQTPNHKDVILNPLLKNYGQEIGLDKVTRKEGVMLQQVASWPRVNVLRVLAENGHCCTPMLPCHKPMWSHVERSGPLKV